MDERTEREPGSESGDGAGDLTEPECHRRERGADDRAATEKSDRPNDVRRHRRGDCGDDREAQDREMRSVAVEDALERRPLGGHDVSRDETNNQCRARGNEQIADETGPVARDDRHDQQEHDIDRSRHEEAAEQRLRPVRQIVQEAGRALTDRRRIAVLPTPGKDQCDAGENGRDIGGTSSPFLVARRREDGERPTFEYRDPARALSRGGHHFIFAHRARRTSDDPNPSFRRYDGSH